MSEILVISFSDLSRDPRVARQIRLLSEHWSVTAAGLAEPAGDVDYVPLKADAPAGAERLLPRGLRVLRSALGRHERAYWESSDIAHALTSLAGLRPRLILANEIAALPLAVRLAGGRSKVVFDAHEYAPGEWDDIWWWRALYGPQAAHLCRRYIPQADAMTTVSQGIAERYAHEFGATPVVIRNAPAYADLEPQPVGEALRMVHFGWADATRRLEEMIETVRFLDERFSLDLVLVKRDDAYLERLHRLAADEPRIRFLPPVPMPELPAFANAYDIGLYLLNATNFNRRYALPNKFFEFVQARLAVAIGPSPEMASLVHRYGFGVVSQDHRPRSLADTLLRLDAEQVWQLKQRAHAAAPELCAEREGERLLELVDGLLGRPAALPIWPA